MKLHLGVWPFQRWAIVPAAYPRPLAGSPAASVGHRDVAGGPRLGYAVPRFPHKWPIAWQAGGDYGAIRFDEHENVLVRLAI